jgi:hypothetical protein
MFSNLCRYTAESGFVFTFAFLSFSWPFLGAFFTLFTIKWHNQCWFVGKTEPDEM